MFKNLFKKTIVPMSFGNQLISLPFLGIVIPSRGNYNRKDFLEQFTRQAYTHGLIKEKHPSHVSYWYDGPCGNMGVLLWEDGAYKRAKNGVIGISRLNILDGNTEYTLEIAKKAVKTLMENNNIVLLLPTEFAEDQEYEIPFYEDLFPEAQKLIL